MKLAVVAVVLAVAMVNIAEATDLSGAQTPSVAASPSNPSITIQPADIAKLDLYINACMPRGRNKSRDDGEDHLLGYRLNQLLNSHK
jgi:hypothetical protein